jgi:hypothetical protein
MKKIELIIGANNEREEEEKVWVEKYRYVMDSRFIEVRSLHTRKTIYLVDSHDIVIRIHDQLKAKLEPGNLLQVFIDGNIYYEAYISQLKEESSVEVKFEESPAKCEVFVKIN